MISSKIILRSRAATRFFSSSSQNKTANLTNLIKNTWSEINPSSQLNRHMLSERLYRAAEFQANQRHWYLKGRVPRYFMARHGMLTLFVWLVHKRLMKEEYLLLTDSSNEELKNVSHPLHEARLVQEEMFEILWNETRAKIRAQPGTYELMTNKHLKEVQQRTYQNCVLLDECFSIQGDEDRFREELGAVVCTFIYQNKIDSLSRKKSEGEEDEYSSDEVPSMLIDRFTEYIEKEYEHITNVLPEKYFQEGRIGWYDSSPNFDDLYDDEDGLLPNIIDQGIENDKDYNLRPNWSEALTDAGEIYYWNMETMETSWDRPTIT